jgi:mannose-6-phosphate isomerase-like protein (cupin superfamily)
MIADLTRLHDGVTAAWMSVDVATVNGNAVRLRVMQDVTAPWHAHDRSDELFLVMSGSLVLDTEHGSHEIQPGQLFVVPAGTRHRARVIGRATVLVVDRIVQGDAVAERLDGV